MGANSSSISELANNEFLQKFAGSLAISENEPFWNQLLSFSFIPPQTSADSRLLEENTISLFSQLAKNNPQTGNFCSLVQIFLTRVAELANSVQCENHVFVWQTHNALFIIRNISKYFLENMEEPEILRQFLGDGGGGSQADMGGEETLIHKLLNSLVQLIAEIPVMSFTYMLHLEAISSLLVLLSVQLGIPRVSSKSIFFKDLMQGKCCLRAPSLVKNLLENFIRHETYPEDFGRVMGGGSLIYGISSAVASGVWTVMTLGLMRKRANPEDHPSPLASQSLLLLLVLTNHFTHDKGVHNPYRQALCNFTDSQEGSSSSPPEGQSAPPAVTPSSSSAAVSGPASFRLSLSSLYQSLCTYLKDDQSTLLLYLLLHRNVNVRTYILSRTDIEQLVLPILRILYDAQEKNSHHIYMALIILLILSEDTSFNKSVHEQLVKNVTWYAERSISEITLGGLIVLVVIRTIQFNMTRMRDKYLHTNCLAALANMSSQFHSLHAYVTQRIISLFELLTKKHSKILDHLRNSTQEEAEKANADPTVSETDYVSDTTADLAVLEEVIRMVLEIINSCLSSMLQNNPNLVYTLLYKKHLFTAYRTNPNFQDIIQNIDTVLSYFGSRLEAQQAQGHSLSVQEVLDTIKQASLQWPRDRLKKFPELKFQYIEEDEPEEFFIPYVWSLVYHSSNIYWTPEKVKLFAFGQP